MGVSKAVLDVRKCRDIVNQIKPLLSQYIIDNINDSVSVLTECLTMIREMSDEPYFDSVWAVPDDMCFVVNVSDQDCSLMLADKLCVSEDGHLSIAGSTSGMSFDVNSLSVLSLSDLKSVWLAYMQAVVYVDSVYKAVENLCHSLDVEYKAACEGRFSDVESDSGAHVAENVDEQYADTTDQDNVSAASDVLADTQVDDLLSEVSQDPQVDSADDTVVSGKEVFVSGDGLDAMSALEDGSEDYDDYESSSEVVDSGVSDEGLDDTASDDASISDQELIIEDESSLTDDAGVDAVSSEDFESNSVLNQYKNDPRKMKDLIALTDAINEGAVSMSELVKSVRESKPVSIAAPYGDEQISQEEAQELEEQQAVRKMVSEKIRRLSNPSLSDFQRVSDTLNISQTDDGYVLVFHESLSPGILRQIFRCPAEVTFTMKNGELMRFIVDEMGAVRRWPEQDKPAHILVHLKDVGTYTVYLDGKSVQMPASDLIKFCEENI